MSVLSKVLPVVCTGAAMLTAASAMADEPTSVGKPAEEHPHFAGIPIEKPDCPMSAATERLYDRWSPLADFDNEFYTLFKYSRLGGIGKEADVLRRDPSKVIRAGGKYYVYYTRRKTKHAPVGLRNYTDDVPDDVPAWDWDLADICYATSEDGFHWDEQGLAVGRNPQGQYADRSLSTPDVLCAGGKYYLYYQAFTGRFSQTKGDRCDVSMAWSDSPDGPWHKTNRPIIELGKPGAWDMGAIHDPYPIVYRGRIWLYYKSDVRLQDENGAAVDKFDHMPPWLGRVLHRMHGVATAERPEGPFTKSPLNPNTRDAASAQEETANAPLRDAK